MDPVQIFTQQTAAIKIQKSYHLYKRKKQYKHLKQLIAFHNEGKPDILIKSVAQSESNLCDAATQLFIKFRLAGKTFPPHIVYKIYTQAPICDVNSFGPRNYHGGLLLIYILQSSLFLYQRLTTCL